MPEKLPRWRGTGRLRVAWSDGPEAWTRFPLPPQNFWIGAIVTGGICAALAVPWIRNLRDLSEDDTGTLSDLMRLLLDASFALGWAVAVLLFFLITLALLLYRDEFRAGAGKLAYVSRMGPLRLFREYELAHVRNVRTGNFAAQGLTNICFEYEGVTAPFGRPLPSEATAGGLVFIRNALNSGAGEFDARAFAAEPLSELEAPFDPELGPQPHSPNPVIAETQDRWGWLSAILLVGANLVPLVGVLLFDWDLAQIMVLFWAENAIIGLYTLLKLAVIQRWGALLLGPFFVGHFGGFMAIHLLFVYQLFVRGPAAKGPEPSATVALATLFAPLWPALVAMLLSHGVSFFENFIGRREYVGRTGVLQMGEPYRRVVLLHFTLIFGGFAVMALGQPVYALVVLVALKIAVDLRAHLRERHRGRLNLRTAPATT